MPINRQRWMVIVVGCPRMTLLLACECPLVKVHALVDGRLLCPCSVRGRPGESYKQALGAGRGAMTDYDPITGDPIEPTIEAGALSSVFPISAGIISAILIYLILRIRRKDTRTNEWAAHHAPLNPTDAKDGYLVCSACGFENLRRRIFCSICGATMPTTDNDGNAERVTRRSIRVVDHGRQRRARTRKEWRRKLDVEGKLYWYRDGSMGVDLRFPGYVVAFGGPAVVRQSFLSSPAANVKCSNGREPTEGDTNNLTQTEEEESERAPLNQRHIGTASSAWGEDITTATRISEGIGNDVASPNCVSTAVGDAPLRPTRSLHELCSLFAMEISSHPMVVQVFTSANPARSAITLATSATEQSLAADQRVITELVLLDFPSKLAEFITRITAVAVPPQQSRLMWKVHRDRVLLDSIEMLADATSLSSRGAIRIEFVGEQGIDAGGVYREWLQLVNEEIVAPASGIFVCSNRTDQTHYLNPHSRIDIGELHLAHFFATGRLLGRGLLEGNVIGFHLSLPLLKIILGLPVSLGDLEYFDPEVHRSLLWIVENNDVDALGLDFSVCEQVGSETMVVDLIPNGRHIPVTDSNKLEFVEHKFRYLLFDSVADQLYAFLRGIYEVIPPELLMLFDAEELDYVLSGSDEIDVNDWESNTKYTEDLLDHSVRRWFWELIHAMPNEHRRRLLQFATGSSRVPLAGFAALTRNDGRICPFTLYGVDMDEAGYIRSHSCFNRLDLPRYTSKAMLDLMLSTLLDTDVYGFTMA